jgi:sulfate adenylyltransferase/3'-phosphoadenosine 5'-phosphosulfate synthase
MSQGFVIWFTGLSGAGKSTLAERIAADLRVQGRSVEVLDGDEVRTHLSKGLGFSKEDRDTNIRRIGYVARVVARNGGIAIAAAISPYREVREEIRIQTPRFVEVYARCSIGELTRRDTKGLYARAVRGEIGNLTGINDPYEPPEYPEVVVDTERESVDESAAIILAALGRRGYIEAPVTERLPATDEEARSLRAEAEVLPELDVDTRAFTDAYMLASGGLSPLRGFMAEADYVCTLERGRLAYGQPFTIPILLRASDEDGRRLVHAPRIALRHGGRPVAIVDVTDTFKTTPEREARLVYGTADDAHPGVALLMSDGTWAIAGEVTLVERPPSPFAAYDRTPLEIQRLKREQGWRTMVGFQTRNPVHRAHEYLQKVTLEHLDGLLLHPLVGQTKSDDIPPDVRMRCYEELLAGYYPADRVLLATNPAWMRYAGPKEAVFHAIVRRNCGCTHFIVGRDHAGVGAFYDTYAAHRIFDEYAVGELGIEILRLENTFFCRACGGFASTRTCPHPDELRLSLSGSRVREILEAGEQLPAEFTRPEVARILARTTAPTP